MHASLKQLLMFGIAMMRLCDDGAILHDCQVYVSTSRPGLNRAMPL